MNVIDEIYRVLKVVLETVRRNLVCVLDFFVVKECSLEPKPRMANIYYGFRGLFLSKVFLAQEIGHFFIFVDEVENFWYTTHFGHEKEKISFDVTANVQKHSRIKLFNRFAWLFDKLLINFLSIKFKVYFAKRVSSVVGFVFFKELETFFERAFLDLNLSKFLLELFKDVFCITKPLGLEVKRFLSSQMTKVPANIIIVVVFIVVWWLWFLWMVWLLFFILILRLFWVLFLFLLFAGELKRSIQSRVNFHWIFRLWDEI